MDIEDLFDETMHINDQEEAKSSHPMVIPEFDPCSGDGTSIV